MSSFFFFFFNDTATTEIYTLSLHDALPISHLWRRLTVATAVLAVAFGGLAAWGWLRPREPAAVSRFRSEEHTSELQSQSNLVCRLLLEKKKAINRMSVCQRLGEAGDDLTYS